MLLLNYAHHQHIHTESPCHAMERGTKILLCRVKERSSAILIFHIDGDDDDDDDDDDVMRCNSNKSPVPSETFHSLCTQQCCVASVCIDIKYY